MAAVGSRPGAEDAQTRAAPPAPRRRGWRILLMVLGLGVALLAADFFAFVHQMPVTEATPTRNADGIVALTGGPFRINDALDLLAAGRGKRLLISGVNPVTRPGEISRLVPEHQRWFACCVDIGYDAIDTIGNAREAANWIHSRGYKSVLVVTNNYHMPRSLAELKYVDPATEFIPYPVVNSDLKTQNWFTNPNALRTMLYEYCKVLLAGVRNVFGLGRPEGLRSQEQQEAGSSKSG